MGIVAGGYFVYGLLGVVFKTQDIHVSLLMPSAGLALASVLLLGNRILPGILIGSFCLNAWSYDFTPRLLLLYLASAVGSAIAAAVGAWLIRRKVGFPNALVDLNSIILFMFLGGPLSCVISASVDVTALIYSGILAWEGCLPTWFDAWSGDIVGVLIITPPILTLFAEPQSIWFRRRSTVGLPIMLLFLLACLLFFYTREVFRQQYVHQLEEKAAGLADTLEKRLQLDRYAVYALRNFIMGSRQFEAEVFSELAQKSLMPFKEIQSVSWYDIIADENKKGPYITVLYGHTAYRNTFLKTVSAELRKKLLNDAGSSENGLLLADENSVKFVFPVIDKADKEAAITGVLIANVLLGDLLHEVFGTLNAEHCLISLSTANATEEAKTIFSNVGDVRGRPFKSISVPVADQVWQISFYYDNARDSHNHGQLIERLVFSSFWFVGLLGMVLLYLTGRYFRAEALIQERTHTLEGLKASAESANQAKNQFLAKISHELRTPLNGISGFTQLLEKKPTLTGEDKAQVAIIKQCSDNLLRLINDILDISAIETKQVKPELSEVNCYALLSDCVSLFKFRAEEKGLVLAVNNDCPTLKFMCDEKRTRQVVANLIDNAIKYTARGSVTVSSCYTGGYLHFSVADTGCGIDAADLERIFAPFVQLNASNFSREGIGLGLSITRELVHLLGGEITVSSEWGVGSLFTVTIPVPNPMDDDGKTTACCLSNDDLKYADVHVLVADDSEINLLFLVCMLEELGCKVDSAVNGLQAFDLIKQNKYHLALIDINMPVMDGMELRDYNNKPSMIAVSAYADKERIQEARNMGFDAYLTKPIEEAHIVELIKNIV